MDPGLGTRLAFIAEWYQEEASIIRMFQIYFYCKDNAIEVFDQRTKKTFLRRTKMKELGPNDFFVGSKICIFGRQFDIVDYGDELTRSNLAKYRKRTFILLKHNIIEHLGMILDLLIQSQFSINKGLLVTFTPEMAKAFLGDKGDVEISVLISQLLAGQSIGFELIADNALEKIKACKSSNNEALGDEIPPQLRTLFLEEKFRNGIYCSQSDEDAKREISFFFNLKSGLSFNPLLNNSTLGVIKPHAIKEGKLGKIISEITNNGFKITSLRMLVLERINCEEFYEVYRGILPEYIQMVAQLASGVCMALEVITVDRSKDSYEEFRNFCGPMDPEVAKLLRPHSLRGKFGENKILNVIHCTDLPEDAVMEIQYFFQILE